MEKKEQSQKSEMSRRRFMGAGMATAAVAAGYAGTRGESSPKFKSKDQHPYNPGTHLTMPTRNLGRTGYQVGILSLGGQATIEKQGVEKEAVAIVDRAVELGVNYIDTAASYGRGVSQKHIGKVMKYRRGEVFLATKTHKRSYDESMRLLEESLTSLQTDHIDLWQLHNVKRQTDIDKIFAKDGAIQAFIKAKEQGLVRFLGITGHYEPLVLLEAIKRFQFDTILMAINAADVHYLSFKNYLLPEAQKQNLGIIGMKIATRSRMLSSWEPPPLDEQPKRLATGKPGTITIREALTYNMSLPVSTNILGCDNVAQVEENIKIASEFTPLSPKEMAEIEFKTLPIVRQGLYFRRWELGA